MNICIVFSNCSDFGIGLLIINMNELIAISNNNCTIIIICIIVREGFIQVCIKMAQGDQ